MTDLKYLNQTLLQDYVGNKRLELSGQLISYMFEVSSSFFVPNNTFFTNW